MYDFITIQNSDSNSIYFIYFGHKFTLNWGQYYSALCNELGVCALSKRTPHKTTEDLNELLDILEELNYLNRIIYNTHYLTILKHEINQNIYRSDVVFHYYDHEFCLFQELKNDCKVVLMVRNEQGFWEPFSFDTILEYEKKVIFATENINKAMLIRVLWRMYCL